MFRAHYRSADETLVTTELEKLREVPKSHFFWIDLMNPTESEKLEIEEKFAVELFTRQEAEEIESSSKYSEEFNEICINSNYLIRQKETFENEPVSFILKSDTLISQRSKDLKTFKDTNKKVTSQKIKSGHEVLITLFEIRIDYDADLIETITAEISQISKLLTRNKNLTENILIKINELQELTILIRENIIEKQRIISSILKSNEFPKENYEKIRVMIKDVGSLLDHTSFNFERLEFLQNTFLGLIDIEQNRVIKIFTVVTVIFMPPTLIASLYGMNFKYMPELDEVWGYPFAIALMVLSSALTLLVFRRKNWL